MADQGKEQVQVAAGISCRVAVQHARKFIKLRISQDKRSPTRCTQHALWFSGLAGTEQPQVGPLPVRCWEDVVTRARRELCVQTVKVPGAASPRFNH